MLYCYIATQDIREYHGIGRMQSRNQKGKGEGGGSRGRGRVPGRTGRRARCCGFAEVLGLSRAELSGTNIGFRDFK